MQKLLHYSKSPWPWEIDTVSSEAGSGGSQHEAEGRVPTAATVEMVSNSIKSMHFGQFDIWSLATLNNMFET